MQGDILRVMLLEGGILSMPWPAGTKAQRKSKKYREMPDRNHSHTSPTSFATNHLAEGIGTD